MEKFKTHCRIVDLFERDDASAYSSPVSTLTLDLAGIVSRGFRSSKYRGFTRTADRRSPWLPLGAEVRNTRQLSLLSIEDLEHLSQALSVPLIKPEWLNANVLVAGLPNFSLVPRGSRFIFPDGLTLIVEDRAAPCRNSGNAVKAHYPERETLEFEFVRAATSLRGVLCSVERSGRAMVGDRCEVLVPSQWIYSIEGESKDQAQRAR